MFHATVIGTVIVPAAEWTDASGRPVTVARMSVPTHGGAPVEIAVCAGPLTPAYVGDALRSLKAGDGLSATGRMRADVNVEGGCIELSLEVEAI